MTIQVTQCEFCAFSINFTNEKRGTEELYCLRLERNVDNAPYENTPPDCPLLTSDINVTLIKS